MEEMEEQEQQNKVQDDYQVSEQPSVPIRLTQMPTTCRVPPNTGIKPGVGRCLRDAGRLPRYLLCASNFDIVHYKQ